MMNIKLDVIMDKLKYQTISKIDNLTVHSGNRFLITSKHPILTYCLKE